MEDKLVVINNTRFAAPPGQPLRTIGMVGDVANVSSICTGVKNEVRVYNYNGVAGDDFQVYNDGSPAWPLPAAPCTTTRAGINGFVCGPVPPLASLSEPAAPTRLAQAGFLLAESGLNRIQEAMRRLFSAPGDSLPSAMVCRAAPAS